jgi:tetratricopeptide (TPR) repeat protein
MEKTFPHPKLKPCRELPDHIRKYRGGSSVCASNDVKSCRSLADKITLSPLRLKKYKPGQGDPAPPAAQPLTRRKLWAFRLALLLLPFVLLAALEAVLRLGCYGFDPHFFKSIKIGGSSYYVQNDDFSFRFFPRDNARSSGALRMRAAKPPGTIRIFIFGESAAMGDPAPFYGPARYLEMQLLAKFPDTKFEIVNTAFAAINSHVILPIARECAAHDGDVWIVYMGNNEMVGPYGAATVFGRRSPSLTYVRFLTAVQTTRVGQLCVSLSRRLHRHGESLPSWGGLQMFMQNEIPPDSPLKQNVYQSFQANLDDIVRAGLGSGAKILLNTVAVNLRDCPPFASRHDPGLSPADLAQFYQSYTNGLRAEAQTNLSSAEANFAHAARVDAKFAELQYSWGKVLLAQTNLPAAREHLQPARDDDALPLRTDSRLNGITRAEAEKHAGPGLVFFNAHDALTSPNADSLCGDETFYEHVHFNFNGAYRLGLAWAQQVAKMLPPQSSVKDGWLRAEECNRRLGLSDWNKKVIWKDELSQLLLPPFSSQPGNTQRVANLQAQFDRLLDVLNTNGEVLARANFQKQIASRPDDFKLLGNYAEFLQSIGDLPGALDAVQSVRKLIPQDFVSLYQLGHVLTLMGRWSEGEQHLRAAVDRHPNFPSCWYELGNAQAAQLEYAAALASLAIAHRQAPQAESPVFLTGVIHAQQDQPTEALTCYREAARLAPDDWKIHFALGGALVAANDLEPALAEFAAAVRLNPGNSRTHYNHGVVLAKLGRLEAARQEFTETLRLDPGDRNAQHALEKIQIVLQRGSQN